MTRDSDSRLRAIWKKVAPAGLPQALSRVREPRIGMRILLAALLLANLAAAVEAFHPFGGAPQQMEQKLARLRAEVARYQAERQRLQSLVSKIERGRLEGEDFLKRFFLPRRSAGSLLLMELTQAADKAGIRVKAHQFTLEPVEGSETLRVLTVTGNYEGNYSDLVHFLYALDRSERLLIIDSMSASPTNAPGVLNVNLKIHAFIQEDGDAAPLSEDENLPAQADNAPVASARQGG